MRSLLFALVAAVAGCSYKAGSFGNWATGQFIGQRATVGCLDVALDRRRSDVEGAPVIEYAFGNRCGRPLTIDLSRVNVVGRTATGEEIKMSPFDPSMELRPLELDGNWAGTETLAYPTLTPVVQICVDAASLTTTPSKEPRWMCFASDEPVDTTVRAVAVDDPDASKTSVDDELEHEALR